MCCLASVSSISRPKKPSFGGRAKGGRAFGVKRASGLFGQHGQIVAPNIEDRLRQMNKVTGLRVHQAGGHLDNRLFLGQ